MATYSLNHADLLSVNELIGDQLTTSFTIRINKQLEQESKIYGVKTEGLAKYYRRFCDPKEWVVRPMFPTDKIHRYIGLCGIKEIAGDCANEGEYEIYRLKGYRYVFLCEDCLFTGKGKSYYDKMCHER